MNATRDLVDDLIAEVRPRKRPGFDNGLLRHTHFPPAPPITNPSFTYRDPITGAILQAPQVPTSM